MAWHWHFSALKLTSLFFCCFSAEKYSVIRRKLALFSAETTALNVVQLPCTAQLPTFSPETCVKIRTIHFGVSWWKRPFPQDFAVVFFTRVAIGLHELNHWNTRPDYCQWFFFTCQLRARHYRILSLLIQRVTKALLENSCSSLVIILLFLHINVQK